MKNYVKTTPSFLTQTTFNTVTGAFTSSNTTGTGIYESLSSVNSVKGDFTNPNPQEFVHEYYHHMSGRETSIRNDGAVGTIRDGLIGPFVSLPAGTINYGLDTNVYNTALSRAYEGIRGTLDLSIDGFQWRQTVGMFQALAAAKRSLNTVNGAISFLKGLRDPRNYAKRWLEYTYGLKPTMSSIYDTFNKCFTEPDHPFLDVIATAKQVTSGRITDSAQFPTTWGYTVSDRVRFQFSVALEHTQNTQLAGFTSMNPVSIAYELTPFSFVADWFLDIGGYLRNLENALLYQSNLIDGFVTRSKRVSVSANTRGIVNSGGVTTIKQHNGTFRHSHKLRSLIATAPFPYPPRPKVDLGASRLVSAASLLSNLLKDAHIPRAR